MDPAKLLALACAFELIPFDRRSPRGHIRELRVERRHTAPEAWAIVSEDAMLTRDGSWEFAPIPSEQDDAYYARCRWPSAEDAIGFALAHLKLYPTGYKPEDCASA